MDLSIIVPVYNVEKYIRSCIDSNYKQSLDDNRFEVIIVNDGTEDNSIGVIADIINQHTNITIINQENQGLSIARNNGIAIAKGEYILMPDSDDLIIENCLLPLLDKALETKADLVVADFIEMFDSEIEQFKGINQHDAEFEIMTGTELFLYHLNPNQCYVWRTLYKRTFIIQEHLTFVPGIFFEDVPFTHECYIKATKCLKTHRLLNIYRRGRKGAYTASFTIQKAYDYCMVIKKTWELTHINGLDPRVLQKIKDDVYTTFNVMLYSALHSIKNSLEILHLLKTLNKEVPDLRFCHGNKQKTETLLFKYTPLLYLTIRKLHWKWIQCHDKTDR